jgi:uncharacterized repeat protein (TIGR01451 family)
MKRILICLLLLAAMLVGSMSVYAAEAEMTVQVCASRTDVQVGDTVEFTVLATGSGVVAMQFNVIMPEGLSYVPNSGRTPEKLAQKLGVPAADWTEQSMMFTFYNDIGITFAKGTEIVRFSCVAEKEGTWEVELYELLPFNEDFEEFPAKLQVQAVKVTGKTASSAPAETKPSVSDETMPAVQPPEQPLDQPAEQQPQQTEPQIPDATQKVTEPENVEDQTQPSQEKIPNTALPMEGEKQAPKKQWKKVTILAIGGIFLVSLSAALVTKIRKNKETEE